MLIHVVNPNTSRSFTDKIDHAARAVASPGTEISATQPAMGPVSIEGYYDEAYAIPGMLARIREAEALGADAHVIACFDDTGLDAARQLARAPVIGIGEAAYHVASLVAGKFAVVTTLALAIPVMEHNLVRYGLATRCAKVRAAGIPVLALEDPASGGVERISAEIEAAKRDDHAEAIVLGCAGMADLAADLSARHGLPVIDGVAAAVTLAESLVRLGVRTSKLGGYAPPPPKPYLGSFAPFSVEGGAVGGGAIGDGA
ncbi:Asp/Glu/hydantoin racemase [Prosthecomicrobium hirschii]|uniref:aspartate/glutamate racemase family protein n=1 Tax=Prosthecodimorpha hirschii TaxID=665126 RepID=UPI0011292170|nr:aspartate/glutamate racemase family protein [Prosthecomicrobium hirschii]TPQ49685.1 Asp/Glu/hydantoin racemase [Prosthecomicrobium hirschii]